MIPGHRDSFHRAQWTKTRLVYNYTEFDILTAVVMKNSAFWDTMPYSPLKVKKSHVVSELKMEAIFSFKAIVTLTDYMVLYPRRQNTLSLQFVIQLT
jgi:hypothetical protein